MFVHHGDVRLCAAVVLITHGRKLARGRPAVVDRLVRKTRWSSHDDLG